MFQKLLEPIVNRYRATKLDQLDWITRNELIVSKGKKDLKASAKRNASLPDRKKILLWGVMPWERGGVEHMMAKSLQARGHHIYGVKCTGGMAACSMESILYPKPNCNDCLKRHDRLLKSMDLQDEYQPIDHYLSEEDRKEIDQMIDEQPVSRLRELVFDGIPIGLKTYNDLPQYYFKIVSLESPEVCEYYRRSIKGVALYTRAARNAIREIKPDRAVVTSGRTVAFSGFYELCKAQNIPVLTWDESVGGLGAFIFCFNDHAVNYHKPGVWGKMSKEPLTSKESDFIDYFFKKTKKGLFGRHQYYSAPIDAREDIISELGLDPHKKLSVLLTNLTWDTSALNKDIGFDSMLHWLTQTIERYIDDPSHQIVIRTHPAEGHAETFAKGCESVSKILHQRFPHLPKHIRVISGKEEYSSHTLADLADHIVVYTTTVGLEMAMMGRRVIITGESHYRNKGFTLDVSTPEKYFNILDRPDREENLYPEEIDLAKKYAYYFIVRGEVYLPEFNFKDRHLYQVLDTQNFIPEQSKHWDALCKNVEDVGDFIDCSEFIDPWVS